MPGHVPLALNNEYCAVNIWCDELHGASSRIFAYCILLFRVGYNSFDTLPFTILELPPEQESMFEEVALATDKVVTVESTGTNQCPKVVVRDLLQPCGSLLLTMTLTSCELMVRRVGLLDDVDALGIDRNRTSRSVQDMFKIC